MSDLVKVCLVYADAYKESYLEWSVECALDSIVAGEKPTQDLGFLHCSLLSPENDKNNVCQIEVKHRYILAIL